VEHWNNYGQADSQGIIEVWNSKGRQNTQQDLDHFNLYLSPHHSINEQTILTALFSIA
jgi:hypothetical protein